MSVDPGSVSCHFPPNEKLGNILVTAIYAYLIPLVIDNNLFSIIGIIKAKKMNSTHLK